MSKVKEHRALLFELAILAIVAGTHALALYYNRPPFGFWAWPLLMSVPAMASLLLRKQYPWLGLMLALTVTIVLIYPDIELGPMNLVILFGVYAACSQTDLRGTMVAIAIAMVYPVCRLLFFEWPFGEGLLMVVGASIQLMMVVGWGWAMRVGKQRAEQLQQTVELLDEARDQLATDAAAIERARIAREFHDIVSHNLSVVALRAGVARALVDRDPEHARETLRELERSSRSALGEMRYLLGALRDGNGESADYEPTPGAREEQERRPAPTLDRLDALVESVRGTGLAWKVDRRGDVRELGQGIEMTAYRIVQEAVTNVLKHAGFGRARILLEYGPNTLTVEVTNKTSGPEIGPRPTNSRALAVSVQSGAYPSSGHGLIGLRERVAVMGGTLTAHPVPNGFHLAAVLPCAEHSDLA